MPWRCVVVAGLAGLVVPGASAQPSQVSGPALALVATYADGRVTESLVPPSGYRAWTPYFPRVDGWRDPQGVLPVRALNLRATAHAASLRVRVSVLRGATHEVEEPIAEVVVELDASVLVDALTRVGLRPVTLAAKRFAAPALHQPRTRSAVDGLVIDSVEPFLDPAPGYRVTLRNYTDVAAVTVAIETWVEGRRALSGQQGSPSAEAIVPSGGTHTFTVGLRSGVEVGNAVASATPFDDVVVAGVIWADGRVEGDRARMDPMLAMHRGRLAAVEAVIEILARSRGSGDAVTTLRGVRDAIAALPLAAGTAAAAGATRPGAEPPPPLVGATPADFGRQSVRGRLLADIERVLPGITAANATRWLDEALPASEAWRTRLRALFPAP